MKDKTRPRPCEERFYIDKCGHRIDLLGLIKQIDDRRNERDSLLSKVESLEKENQRLKTLVNPECEKAHTELEKQVEELSAAKKELVEALRELKSATWEEKGHQLMYQGHPICKKVNLILNNDTAERTGEGKE